MWTLLAGQAARFTMDESSSVPAETAQELTASLWLTLKKALDAEGLPYRALLTNELSPLLARGRAVLQAQEDAARTLWEKACLTAPALENDYFRDTLTGIGLFFKKYDLRFFAHQIPCSIDYPLLTAVPEALPGVDYVTEYLKRILMENDLLRRFAPADVTALLESVSEDFRRDYLNLCEQPLVNSIGRALIRKPAGPLRITQEDREKILLIPAGSRKSCIAGAARTVGAELGCPAPVCGYLAAFAEQLVPRFTAAVENGDLSHVFVSFRTCACSEKERRQK